MPIFDFYCEDCKTEQNDVLIKDADNAVLCTKCNRPMLKRPPHINFTMTPGAISRHKKRYGNKLPDEYKTSGGANIYGIPKK